MRVLLIDDDPTCRKAARAMLERSGFEVAEAANGAEGLNLFRRGGFDVLLSDVFMPDVDGLQLIQQLRQEAPGAHVIAMSGGAYAGRLELLTVARLLGAARVLHKPFGRAELAGAIQAAAGA